MLSINVLKRRFVEKGDLNIGARTSRERENRGHGISLFSIEMPLPQSFLDTFDQPFGFLDFASVGAMSIPARAGIIQMAEAMSGAEGKLINLVTDRFDSCRRRAANLIGVTPQQITLVPNTSAGLFAAAFGLSGGSVVVPDTEFPANLYPWVRAAEAGRIELRTIPVPEGRLTADLIAREVDTRTLAVSLSQVDYRTGFRCDLDAMREAAGDALLIVDAVQAVGAVRSVPGQADLLVAGGHKWLRAGGGVGLMAVSDRALERLEPTLTGWSGVTEPFETDPPLPHPPLEDAGRFAMGTPGLTALAAFDQALEILEGISAEDLEAAVLARSRAVEEGALQAGAQVMRPWKCDRERSGIVSFRPAGERPAQAFRRLVEEGFSLTERNGMLRVAPHAGTHPDAPQVLAQLLRRKRRKRIFGRLNKKPA